MYCSSISKPKSSANSFTFASSGPNGFAAEDFLLGRIEAVLIERPTPRADDLAGMIGSEPIVGVVCCDDVAISELARLTDFVGGDMIGVVVDGVVVKISSSGIS